jgi:recombination protein RecT
MSESTKKPEPKEVPAIEVFRMTVQRMATELKSALPLQIPVERFIRTTITAVQMAPALLDADRRTLLAATMRAAQDGLLPDGREAALVIFKSKSGTPTVQYMPMIAGLFKKARNSGEIASMSAHVAYEKDQFDYSLGDDEHILHKPLLSAERGKPIAAYAIIRTKDGGIYRDVMDVHEIEKVRKSSRARDDGPWVDWWDEMAKKTVFRRLAKRAPSSADLEQTLEHEDEVTGFVQQPGSGEPAVIDWPPRGPSRTRALVEEQTKDETPPHPETAKGDGDA